MMKNRLKKNIFFYFLLLISLSTFAQEAVEGKITSSDNLPIPGVIITEVGTKNSALSNFDGNYTIRIKSNSVKLMFSFVGFASQTIELNNQKTINVQMREDMQQLANIVVIGYGSVKKSDVTGSVTSVKMKALESIPANSIDGLLQGRVAGLQVISSSQDPGAGSTIRIRGASSLSGSNDPLVVVDGFPLGGAGNIKQINPSDIESVEVLKDASASAIYGSRGANGVIMITTKKAKAGNATVEINYQTSIKNFSSNLIRWNDPILMAELSNERSINDGMVPMYIGQSIAGTYYPSLAEIANGTWPHNTNWAKVVFRNSPITNNTTVSIRGANDKTSFNISANNFSEKGMFVEDDYNKNIINVGVSHKFSNWLKINTSNILSKDKRNNNGGLDFNRNPLWPIYNENGDYFRTSSQDFGHPLAYTENVLNTSKGLDIISSYLFDFTLDKHFSVKTQLNYKYGTYITDGYRPKDYTWEGNFYNGVAYINNWQAEDVLSETFATYNNTFNDLHSLNVMVGQSYQNNVSRSSDLRAQGFVNEALGNENMSAGDPEANEISNNKAETKLLSYYGRINYMFNDKYLFTGTMRADGSSKFGENNKWGYFPSGALSWKAHKEEFIKNIHVFDELKFRLSYGISGNQGISPYQTLSRYGVENYYDDGQWKTAIGPGFISGRFGPDGRYNFWSGIPNKDLKWESTGQLNIGVDMAFFNRRFNATIDVYRKTTTDLLRQKFLPLSSSYSRIWINDGEILNQGIEISFDTKIIRKGDFTMSSNLIVSVNRNEITSLGDTSVMGLLKDPNTGMDYEFQGAGFDGFGMATSNIFAVGQPMNVFYGYKTNGIIQSIQDGLESLATGDMARPGEFKYLDINEDGRINENDRTIIGNPNPDFTASFSMDFTYRKFDLSLFFNGVFGNDIFNPGKLGQANIMPLRWTVDNPNNEYPALRSIRNLLISDWFVEDGSFVRIQNVTFGYNLDTVKTSFINKARLYINATNLFTITSDGFKGYDPEVGLDGIYYGGYPRTRNITLGLTLTF
jgi:TonB-linked SusC/RagA family outer membrane protein